MNCASVTITGLTASRRRKRQGNAASSMSDLPYIWVANLAEVNNCTTAEGVDPVYPDPGPEVEYGTGLSSSSPPSPKDCEDSTPGPAYTSIAGFNGDTFSGSNTPLSSTDVAATSSPTSAASSSVASSGAAGMSTNTNTPMTSSSLASGGLFVQLSGNPTISATSTVKSGASTSTSSFTTITITESETTTMTITRHTSTPSTLSSTTPTQVTLATSGTSQGHRVATAVTVSSSYSTASTSSKSVSTSYVDHPSLSYSYSTVTLPPTSFHSTIGPSQSHRNSATTSISVPIDYSTNSVISLGTDASAVPTSVASPSTPASSSIPSSSPLYAQSTNSDYTAYLPCVQGTFLCTSNTTFLTCDNAPFSSSSSPAYTWTASRSVAAGMQCLPNLSPYSGSIAAYQGSSLGGPGQMAVPNGYYRDDKYVRSTTWNR